LAREQQDIPYENHQQNFIPEENNKNFEADNNFEIENNLQPNNNFYMKKNEQILSYYSQQQMPQQQQFSNTFMQQEAFERKETMMIQKEKSKFLNERWRTYDF